eukprot:TRINITY_DN56277_c0_g1_i1.p1 TRINITY_DN56277_c0_g1~~TRINITY_DN56277_c0_g1_i1.p1  ORF type:complete len:409 (-),score=48.18 TRINITY_DN56277_c0_g1_i1:141-1367(-)
MADAPAAKDAEGDAAPLRDTSVDPGDEADVAAPLRDTSVDPGNEGDVATSGAQVVDGTGVPQGGQEAVARSGDGVMGDAVQGRGDEVQACSTSREALAADPAPYASVTSGDGKEAAEVDAEKCSDSNVEDLLLLPSEIEQMSMEERRRRGCAPIPDRPGKRGLMAFGCCGGVGWGPGSCEYYHTLRIELANSVYWSGNIILDYIFFVCQWHPLLGIFLCHPNHPYRKMDRIFILSFAFTSTIVPSVSLGAFYSAPVFDGYRHYVIMIVAAVQANLVAFLLYQISMAKVRCPGWARVWEWFMNSLMLITVILFLVSSFTTITVILAGDVSFLQVFIPFFQGIWISYLLWFPAWFLLPFVGFLHCWCSERRILQQQLAEENNGAGRLTQNMQLQKERLDSVDDVKRADKE